MTRPLTDKQLAFCDEYLIDWNAAAAARRAGYAARSAKQTGSDLMQDPRVMARLAELNKRRRARVEVSQDDVVEELRRTAFSDIRDVAEWDAETVRFIASGELTPEIASTVKKIKAKLRRRIDDDGVELETLELEIEMHDKLNALGKLMTHLGMDGKLPPGTEDKPLVIVVRKETR